MLSILIAGPFLIYLSNSIGRKRSLIISCLIASSSLLIAGITKNEKIFILMMFLSGFGFSGLETIGRVYLSEISGDNFRINSQAVLNCVWALA